MAIQNHTGNSLMEYGGSGVLSMLFSICNYVYRRGAYWVITDHSGSEEITEKGRQSAYFAVYTGMMKIHKQQNLKYARHVLDDLS
jgi:hypothetical protein